MSKKAKYRFFLKDYPCEKVNSFMLECYAETPENHFKFLKQSEQLSIVFNPSTTREEADEIRNLLERHVSHFSVD